MKTIFFITLFVTAAMQSFAQKKIDPTTMKSDTLIYDYSNPSMQQSKQIWNNYLASEQLKKITGVVINGKKYETDGLDQLKQIPENKISRMTLIKEPDQIKKYFRDTLIKFMFVVETKQSKD
ncbi:hypothetical protein [Chitinophaga vietnamensis]|uniref:hypothetical protein n=1 Tax=Chitinophaga vietnamensis TaxID=2593957 RepID=UPI0011781DCC|nr:hypothetical protein [Chitinophaga vietnamensis]